MLFGIIPPIRKILQPPSAYFRQDDEDGPLLLPARCMATCAMLPNTTDKIHLQQFESF